MDVIEKTYDTNVYSVLRLCKAVIPHMAARKSGTIVNISSIGAYMSVCPSAAAIQFEHHLRPQ